MSEFAICDHFKWSIEDLRKLSLKEYIILAEYFKKLEKKHKEDERKAKMRAKGRRR